MIADERPMTDTAEQRHRLARSQAQLAELEVEGRQLLKAAGIYLDHLARTADDTDDEAPLARDLADRITAVLDRRATTVMEIHEQAREVGVDR